MTKIDAHKTCPIRHNCHYQKFENQMLVFDSHPATCFDAVTPYGAEIDYPICDDHRKLLEPKGWVWSDVDSHRG